MHIDGYTFGRMVVDGVAFTSDLILLPDRVVDGWWRREGHRLDPADLAAVASAAPAVVVIGTGASGCMAVPEATRRWLEGQGAKVKAAPSSDAVTRYYTRAATAERVVGCFHLTC